MANAAAIFASSSTISTLFIGGFMFVFVSMSWCFGSLIVGFRQVVMIALPKRRVLGAMELADGFQDLIGRARFGEQGERRTLKGLLHEFAARKAGMDDYWNGPPALSDFL